MTAPGSASEVGSIIGYLSLNRSDWNRGVDDTERDADRLGRLRPDIRIRTNAGDVAVQLALVSTAERKIGSDAAATKPFVVNLWAALAALAPAALPIAGVLGGAMVGLIPLVATVALGLTGINEELKSGQLEGTKYGDDLHALGVEVDRLKKMSADGILSGVDRGLAASHGLFAEVNQDIGVMAGQVGNIVADGGPALLRIFTQLNPLFVTFGDLVSRGASELNGWTQHSKGVQHFVAYVQTELPKVMAFLGNLIVLFSHLAQGLAPYGSVLLTGLTGFVRILNLFPVGLIQDAIPLVIALYAAFKTYGAVTAIVAGVNNAINSMKAPLVTTAATAAAESAVIVQSSQAVALAAADEAVAVARAKVTEAEAVAAAAAAMTEASAGTASLFEAEAVTATGAAADITASWAGVASLFATDSNLIAESAAVQVEAYQAAAASAVLSAEEIAAASVGASNTVAASGKKAAIGWTGLLGPLAAVGIGLVLLTTLFLGNDNAARHNQEIMDGYAQSLKQNADALAKVNLEQTAKNLKDEGAITLADKLSKNVSGLGLDYGSLTLAVNGSEAQFSDLYVKLLGVADAGGKVSAGTTAQLIAMSHLSAEQLKSNYAYDSNGRAAIDLAFKIKTLRGAMTQEMKIQEQLNAINRDAQEAANGGATATAALARALGVTRDAYIDAQLAAKKNVEQTKAQALAFRLANDGGALLALTLDKLSGKKLGYAQALNSFQQQLTSGAPAKDDPNGTKVKGKSASAVQNRGNILGLVTTAESAAEDYGKLHGGTEAARSKLVELRKELIQSRVDLGENRADVTAYVNSILTIPPAIDKASLTPLEIKTAAVHKKINALQDRIDRIKQGKEPHLAANSVEANGVIDALQLKIDKLKGKTVKIDVLTTVVGKHTEAGNAAAQQAYLAYLAQLSQHKAAGGEITGPGPKGVDSVPLLGAPGEYMMNNRAVDKYGLAFMRSVNNGTLNLRGADAGAPRGSSAAAANGMQSGPGSRSVRIDKFEQHFHYPEPERPSQTTSRSMEMAAYALDGS